MAMSYNVNVDETMIKYTICHDIDTTLSYKVIVEPIGAVAHILVIKEDYMDSVCIIIRVYHEIATNVQVTLTLT